MSTTYDYTKNESSYIGFPFITHIDGIIANELSSRSADRVRAISSFIRVTPGFTPDGTSESRIVLEGIQSTISGNPSQYGFKDLYRPDKSFRPLAGVKSLNVDFKNKFGSIRKATIQWSCHSTDDLEQLSQYFLNPGYTILIEWGWNKGTNVLFDLKSDKICLANYLPQVRRKIKESNGNYDAMLGIVINYNWSLNKDGGFDCTTEVLSSGVLMEGITIPDQKTTEVNKDGEVESGVTTFQHYLKKIYYAQIERDSKLFNKNNIKKGIDYFIHVDNTDFDKINDEVKKTKDGSDAEQSDLAEFLKEELTEHPIYLSWGYIEDRIINPNIEIKPGENSGCAGTTGNIEKKLFSYNSVGSKIGHHKFLRTTDLGVCIVPEQNLDTFKNEEGEGNSGKKGTDFTDIINWKFDDGDFEASKGLRFGYVRRLLIHAEFFRQTMLSSTNLTDGVLNLFSKINDACGSYWEFVSVNREFSFNESGELNTNAIETPKETPPTQNNTVEDSKPGVVNYFNNYNNKNAWRTESTLPNNKSPNVLIENQKNQIEIESALKTGKNGVDAIYKYSIVDTNFTDTLEVTPENVYIFRTRSFDATNIVTGNTYRATSIVKNLSLSAKLSNQSALNVFYSAQRGDSVIHGLPSSTVYHSLYKTQESNIDNTVQQSDIDNPKKFAFWKNIGSEKKVSTKHDIYSSGPYKTPENSETSKENTDNEFSIAEENGFSGNELKEYNKEYPDSLKVYLPLRSTGWNAGFAKYKNKDVDFSGAQGMKIVVLMNEGKEKNLQSVKSNAAIIPVVCEIELEGISGIRVGDSFSIDALPTIYKERGFFQCIGLVQDVTKDIWVTKIKGGYRIRRDDADVATNTTRPINYSPNARNVINVVGNRKITAEQIKDRTRKAMKYFIGKGFTVLQSAALVGGFIQESNLNPAALNSIEAFGIAQWVGSRRETLLKKYPEMKNIENTDEMFYKQLDYVMYEFKTDGLENSVYNALKNASELKNSNMAAARFERFWAYNIVYNSNESVTINGKTRNAEWGSRVSYTDQILNEKLY